MLTNSTPIARNSDVLTSHLSDRYLTKSGKRLSQIRLVEYAVRKRPGYTASELAAITGLPHSMLHKRLPDSNNVEKGEIVTCLITGYPAHVWVVK